MANAVTFGVGCFHFAPRRMLLEDFSRDVFVGDLRAGLETINSVKQVTIEGFEWFSAGGGGFVSSGPIYKVDGIDEGPGLYPHAITAR